MVLMTKKIQTKGIDLRISLAEGQCVNHYTMEPNAIAIIFKLTLVYALLPEFSEFIEEKETVSI